MIMYGEDGKLLFPEEYCKINNIKTLSNDDCYYYIKGNTSNIEEYFKDNFNKLNFEYQLPNFHVWRHTVIDDNDTQELIKNNEFLSKVNEKLKISCFLILESSKNSLINWHFDVPRKGPALNLLLTPEARSASLFTNDMYDLSNLVECKYLPHQFVLYNTDMVHSILNFETVRYMFSACFERGKTDLSWEEAKTILSEIQ